jgi:hypothetical protein
VIGWLGYGPRDRIDKADLLGFLVVPVAWLVYPLVRGEIVDWYPYPFVDVGAHGYACVAGSCVAVAALMFALAVGAQWLDRRLPPAPQAAQATT